MELKALTVNLMVENVQRSVDFYNRTFGFEVVTTVPGENELVFALVKRDEVSLMFQSMKSFAEAMPEYKNTKIGGSILLYIDVIKVHEIYEMARKSGVEIVVEMHKTFYGTNEFAIRDCDGYLVSFAQDAGTD
ncbi:MAG TPA: VOC family protein [Bacteroidia bacterium]|nr:VOC family protein [Bacteroidia bacterium]